MRTIPPTLFGQNGHRDMPSDVYFVYNTHHKHVLSALEYVLTCSEAISSMKSFFRTAIHTNAHWHHICNNRPFRDHQDFSWSRNCRQQNSLIIHRFRQLSSPWFCCSHQSLQSRQFPSVELVSKLQTVAENCRQLQTNCRQAHGYPRKFDFQSSFRKSTKTGYVL